MLFSLQSVQTCGDVMSVTVLISSISGVGFVGESAHLNLCHFCKVMLCISMAYAVSKFSDLH